MLDLNVTLLFQLANFFIALVLLNVLLIKPVREVLRKRQQILDDMTGEAGSFEEKAEASLKNYESQLAQARQDATAAREASRAAGVAEQQGIVEAAQKTSREILDEARRSLQEQANATLASLRAQVAAVSQRVADKLVQG